MWAVQRGTNTWRRSETCCLELVSDVLVFVGLGRRSKRFVVDLLPDVLVFVGLGSNLLGIQDPNRKLQAEIYLLVVVVVLLNILVHDSNKNASMCVCRDFQTYEDI